MLFRHLFPAFAWALLILGICALPGTVIPDLSLLDWLKPDKLVHLFLFGVLAFLLMRGFRNQTTVSYLYISPGWVTFISGSLYGILTEFLQEHFFVKRYGEASDAVADSLGVAVGIALFNYLVKRQRMKKTFH